MKMLYVLNFHNLIEATYYASIYFHDFLLEKYKYLKMCMFRVNYIRYALNLILLKNLSQEFKISPQFLILEQLI